jgi:hypothetical protein
MLERFEHELKMGAAAVNVAKLVLQRSQVRHELTKTKAKREGARRAGSP